MQEILVLSSNATNMFSTPIMSHTDACSGSCVDPTYSKQLKRDIFGGVRYCFAIVYHSFHFQSLLLLVSLLFALKTSMEYFLNVVNNKITTGTHPLIDLKTVKNAVTQSH